MVRTRYIYLNNAALTIQMSNTLGCCWMYVLYFTVVGIYHWRTRDYAGSLLPRLWQQF